MTEGKEVRTAYDGPSIEHDTLIDFIHARNREDQHRSSSAGETRQKIGEFIEKTSMNGKALAWCRQILKANDKEDGQHKAMDIIMSLKAALPMVEAHVAGQGTVAMDFDEPTDGDGFGPDDFVNDAFGRGGAAYAAGVSKEGNPFDEATETAHHQLWNRGWTEAYDEDVAENFEDLDAKTNEPMTDDEIDDMADEMDDDLEEAENVTRPHFGGDAA